jgi:hypothetical protein
MGLFCGWRAGKEKRFGAAPRARGIKLQKSQTPDNAGYRSSFRRASNVQASCRTNPQATSCLKISLNQRADMPDLLM